MSNSEMWQRIKAAREFAGLTQKDLAEVCGVSRPAVSLWERSVDRDGVSPLVKNVHLIASACGVPVDFLLNDRYSTGDVLRLGDRSRTLLAIGPEKVLEQAKNNRIGAQDGVLASETQHDLARRKQSFLGAVEFGLGDGTSGHFNRKVSVAGFTFGLDFYDEHNLAHVVMPDQIAAGIGHLLASEKAIRSKVHKHLLVWGKMSPAPDQIVLQNTFGIQVTVVANPPEAMQYLQTL